MTDPPAVDSSRLRSACVRMGIRRMEAVTAAEGWGQLPAAVRTTAGARARSRCHYRSAIHIMPDSLTSSEAAVRPNPRCSASYAPSRACVRPRAAWGWARRPPPPPSGV
jgi:hypothetical protein